MKTFPVFRFPFLLSWIAGICLVFGGCQSETVERPEREGPVQVVATFDLLANLVEEIGGDLVTVETLTPAGQLPKTYTPDEADLRAVAGAGIFVEAGLAFEPWAENLYRTSSTEARRLPLAHFVTLLPEPDDAPSIQPEAHAPEHGHAHAHDEADEGHDHQAHSHDEASGHRHGHGPGEHTHSQYDPAENTTGLDPRFWLDIRRVQRVANGLRNALVQADPDNEETYHENARRFTEQLASLDEPFREKMANIPADRRLIVTDADRVQYLAERYGMTVAAVAPAAGETYSPVEAIAERIRDYEVDAVFASHGVSAENFIEAADSAGVRIIYLHTESLGETATSYVEAMEENFENLAAAFEGAETR